MIRTTAAALLAVLAVAGCGRVTVDDPNGRLTSSTTRTSSTAAAPTPGGVTSPNDVQRGALLVGLRSINPALATDEDKAITQSRNVCQKLQAGEDANDVTTYIKAEFSSSAYTVTQNDALGILTLVRGLLCPA